MVRLPRLAVGAVQPDTATQPVVSALAEAFRRIGVRVQSFLSRADFPRLAGGLGSTGLNPRHLDSWLMSPDACRALFVYGTRCADLALVQGRFQPRPDENAGGQLEPLCRWLDLPRIVVLDVTRVEDCRLPEIPRNTAGLFLDGISDAQHLARLTTNLESLLGVPVLGALEQSHHRRAAAASVPRSDRTATCLCRHLGDSFARWWKPAKILELSVRREMPAPGPSWLEGGPYRRRKLTVAIAYDDAFNGYFADTLDLLELHGASVIGFSPLRDEHLPPQTDVAVFGCGNPERYAAMLSENHCMVAALRSHLSAGRRIYGEGGGAAYLCQSLAAPPAEWKRMAGVLPAVAHRLAVSAPPKPVEVRLPQSSWLGCAGTRLRGFQNSNWQFTPLNGQTTTVAQGSRSPEFVGDYQAIGSLVHLDFAADQCFLNRLFNPEPWTSQLQSAAGIPE